jgi:twitching motility two-component system response regulator PilG
MVGQKQGMSDVELLRRAVEAARAGDKPEARRLLSEAAQVNPQNEKVWLWRASLAITPQVAATYIQYVLRINPNNATAKAWLDRLGAKPPSAPAEIPSSNQAAAAAPANATVTTPAAAATPPSAPEPAQAAGFECPICAHGAEAEPDWCTGCGAVLVLNATRIAKNEGVDERKLNAAIARVKAQPGWEGSFDAHRLLAVIQLNLTNTGAALEHLLRAKQLRSTDETVWAQVLHLMTRPLVMVIDDSLTIRAMVARTLEHNGFRTRCCASGSEALSQLRNETPKLILLDVSMPQMDGYQVCKLIKSLKETKQVPVVMLSGNDGFFDKVKGRMAGAADYLTKPFEPETAIRTIRRYTNEQA